MAEEQTITKWYGFLFKKPLPVWIFLVLACYSGYITGYSRLKPDKIHYIEVCPVCDSLYNENIKLQKRIAGVTNWNELPISYLIYLKKENDSLKRLNNASEYAMFKLSKFLNNKGIYLSYKTLKETANIAYSDSVLTKHLNISNMKYDSKELIVANFDSYLRHELWIFPIIFGIDKANSL